CASPIYYEGFDYW
nr:immunoglobulin heavy chain junction region [Mus musculus]NSM03756.1 immunoglobulin heavy chain junction region [Mus musculus]NSM03928.1 immunoglobulin heavy chain junction region [Mus musculus]NSM04299.1 immunoglobulin heavy chain junction region [Mus musculus]NSM04343.1 immunoglobulin heavy chain junction region [Mus musculus]